ncbi:MAG: TRAP transporter TatT component family protein [Desulfobulbales bacterium]
MTRKATTTIPAILLLAGMLLLFNSGCASLVVNPMLKPLTLSLQKQTDLDLLQEGAPSLLLLLDGLIAADPSNEHLLMSATQAYGVYATILYEDGKTERAVNMSIKAKEYGISLINRLPGIGNIADLTLADVEKKLAAIPPSQVGYMFWGAYGWAIWIKFQEGAPAAMADLPIVEHIMLRVVALDESYYHGGAHIFLGSYYGSRPQIYGGKPVESRKHFERALAINKRKYLLTQVAYAQTYARMMFDRQLYLDLLTEVIKQPLVDSDMAASNKLAKVMAEKLINQVDEFF